MCCQMSPSAFSKRESADGREERFQTLRRKSKSQRRVLFRSVQEVRVVPIPEADHVLPDVALGVLKAGIGGRQRREIPDPSEKIHQPEPAMEGLAPKQEEINDISACHLGDPIGFAGNHDAISTTAQRGCQSPKIKVAFLS